MPLKSRKSDSTTDDLSMLKEHVGRNVWVSDGDVDYKGILKVVNAKRGTVSIKFPSSAKSFEVVPVNVFEENHVSALYQVPRKTLRDRARERAGF